MRWGALLAALLLVGLSVRTSPANRWRAANKELAIQLDPAVRFVDLGVILRVVKADPSGTEYLPGKPKLAILREHKRGGVFDRYLKRFVSPSGHPRVWYVSEQQESIVLHDNTMPLNLLVYGAMGAGKTTSLAMWVALRAIEFSELGDCEIGITAPIAKRFAPLKQAIRDLWPKSWWTWKERDQLYTLANGVSVRLVQTHRQSEAEGSPVQAYSWVAAASDELQDSIEADGDIEARGRDAPGGVFKRLNTATAKDSPQWRNFRDRILSTGVWGEYRMVGPGSPFQTVDYWDRLAKTMPIREYQRKVLAQDVAPENAIYTEWDRRESLLLIPDIGAATRFEDVTSRVLKQWGNNIQVLVGSDPGNLYNVSLFLKAFRYTDAAHRYSRHFWVVVDEVTSKRSTYEGHAKEVLAKLRSKYRCNELDWSGKPSADGAKALVRVDPSNNGSGNDTNHPDQTVYTVFRALGLQTLAATYANTAMGMTVKHGRVPKEAGINMVNTLLKNTEGERRLFVACDSAKQPLAPRLVDSFERMERDAAGKAETETKGEGDLSHWPAALRYALWALENPSMAVAMQNQKRNV